MTTLCIDTKKGEMWSDSRASWNEETGLFSMLTGLNKKFCYEDDTVKIYKLGDCLVSACGRVSSIEQVLEDLKEGKVYNHYYFSGDDAACRVFIMTNETGRPIVKCYSLIPQKTFVDYLLSLVYIKYKVVVEWHRDCVIFSGSGGVYAKQSYDEKFDIEHAMYCAKVRDKYSGGDIVCQTLK